MLLITQTQGLLFIFLEMIQNEGGLMKGLGVTVHLTWYTNQCTALITMKLLIMEIIQLAGKE